MTHQESIVHPGRNLAEGRWTAGELSVYLALILSCTALPVTIPTSFTVGGLIFQLYEPFLAVAALYVLARRRPSKYVFRRFLLVAASLGVGLTVGILNENSLQKIYQDVRLPIILAVGILVAGGIASTEVVSRCLRLLPWILWISAAVIVLASTTGLEIGGRTESVMSSEGGDATRLLSPTTFLAVAVLCGFVGIVVARKLTLRSALKYALPALVIIGLSFSRNHLLALGVSLVFTIVALRSIDAIIGLLGLLVTAILFVCVCVLLLSALPSDSWLSEQVTAYSARVLEGSTGSSLSSDASVGYRVEETSRIVPVIEQSPIVGQGMGAAYQPPEGQSGQFLYDRGPYYAHNFYLWLLLKAGVVGLTLFLLAVLGPIWRALRAPNKGQLVAGAGTAAFLAVNFVAPLPLGTPESLILGALIGLLAGYSRDRALGEERLNN